MKIKIIFPSVFSSKQSQEQIALMFSTKLEIKVVDYLNPNSF